MRAINFGNANATSSPMTRVVNIPRFGEALPSMSVCYCLVARANNSKVDGVMDYFYRNARDNCSEHYLAHMNLPQELTLLICSVTESKISWSMYIIVILICYQTMNIYGDCFKFSNLELIYCRLGKCR